MARTYTYTRPTFAEALKYWQNLLQERGAPAEITWIFDENICFEKAPEQPAGCKIGYQASFTPPPEDAELIAYKYFAAFEAPVVFFCIGTSHGRSVCLLLCDTWFEKHLTHEEEYVRRDDWFILFRPGKPETIEEIIDEQRWKNRIIRGRPLHELDFCMTLRSIHEILAHGRVLTSYEHYALRLLSAWRRVFGPQA